MIKQLSIGLLMLVYVAILFAISVPLTLSILSSRCSSRWRSRANIGTIRDVRDRVGRVNAGDMGKIVERFGMIRLIKLRDQKSSESERIEDVPDRCAPSA